MRAHVEGERTNSRRLHLALEVGNTIAVAAHHRFEFGHARAVGLPLELTHHGLELAHARVAHTSLAA